MKKVKLLFLIGLVVIISSIYIFFNPSQEPILGGYWSREQELNLDIRLENVELAIIDAADISKRSTELILEIVNNSQYLVTFGNAFSIEYNNGIQWLRSSQGGETRLIDYLSVQPGETINFNRDFSHFPIDLGYPGLYRIRQTVTFGDDFSSHDLIAEFYVE